MIEFGATISGVALLRNLDTQFAEYHQASIKEAALAGKRWLTDQVGEPGHTPYRTGNLVHTVGIPIENQYSVTFKIAGLLSDPIDGKEKPYGFAQENGWHDRAGGYHEGQHMVHNAALEAARVYVEFMTQPGAAWTSVPGNRVDYYLTEE